jgi:hypothetical protein
VDARHKAGHDEWRVATVRSIAFSTTPESPRAARAALFSFCEIAVRTRPRLTRARLRELLHYDPETGEFRWRKRMNGSVRVNDVAGCLTPDGYRRISIASRLYRAHHLAWLDGQMVPGDDRSPRWRSHEQPLAQPAPRNRMAEQCEQTPSSKQMGIEGRVATRVGMASNYS